MKLDAHGSMSRNYLTVKGWLSQVYRAYIDDYKHFLRYRGFGEHINDRYFVRRGFLECWMEPGFHRFWQVWNPGIGYFAYKLYTFLGGNKRQKTATLITFLINGFTHNLIVSILLWRWEFPLSFTFLSFGIFTIASRWVWQYLDLTYLPRAFHLALNIGLIIISFDFGFAMNALIITKLHP